MSTQIPFTLARNLPVYTGTLDSDSVSVVLVTGNTGTARASLSSWSSSFVKLAGDVPSAVDTPYAPGTVAWDSTGLYVSTTDGWAKVPFYFSNWDDMYAGGLRFLRVDGAMDLSDNEKAHARKSIGVQEATTDTSGTVRLAGGMKSPGIVVPTATQVVDYVAGAIGGLPDMVEQARTLRDETSDLRDSAEQCSEDACRCAAEAAVSASEAHGDASRASTALVSALEYATRAEDAAARAEQASEIVDFDDVPEQGSMSAVRSGGIYSWTFGNFAYKPDFDVHAGDTVAHVTQEDRDRWDAAPDDWATEEDKQAVRNLSAGDSVVKAGSFSVYTSDSATPAVHVSEGNGKVVVNTSALAIESGTVDFNASHLQNNGLDILDEGDAGTYDYGGSVLDGYASTASTYNLVNRIRSSTIEYVDGLIPDVSDCVRTGADNVLTGSNLLTGDTSFTGSVAVAGDASVSKGLAIDPVSSASEGAMKLENVGGELYWNGDKVGSGGGEAGGDVYADGNNVFTGENSFEGTLLVSQPVSLASGTTVGGSEILTADTNVAVKDRDNTFTGLVEFQEQVQVAEASNLVVVSPADAYRIEGDNVYKYMTTNDVSVGVSEGDSYPVAGGAVYNAVKTHAQDLIAHTDIHNRYLYNAMANACTVHIETEGAGTTSSAYCRCIILGKAYCEPGFLRTVSVKARTASGTMPADLWLGLYAGSSGAPSGWRLVAKSINAITQVVGEWSTWYFDCPEINPEENLCLKPMLKDDTGWVDDSSRNLSIQCWTSHSPFDGETWVRDGNNTARSWVPQVYLETLRKTPPIAPQDLRLQGAYLRDGYKYYVEASGISFSFNYKLSRGAAVTLLLSYNTTTAISWSDRIRWVTSNGDVTTTEPQFVIGLVYHITFVEAGGYIMAYVGGMSVSPS